MKSNGQEKKTLSINKKMRYPMKKFIFGFILALFMVVFTVGCKSAYPVEMSDSISKDVVIFTRPNNYSLAFGSKSLSEYIELSSYSLQRNAAGMLEATVGIQYRGPHNWYNVFRSAPSIVHVNARADFYAGDIASGAPIYSTNRQTLVLRLGDSTTFKAVCPRQDAQSCQIVLSE